MNNLFLTKLTGQLVLTDGIKYAPIGNSLQDFLNSDTIPDLPLTLDLPSAPQFESLVETDFQIFATGCTFEWSKEKLISLPSNDVYKKLYQSERSMFFYKGNKNNLAPVDGKIGIRSDSEFTIPEAEVVAVFNSLGKIIGFTLGNDVTAVDLEKENPLYQTQAKFYQGSVALLPMIKLGSVFPMTNLKCQVIRDGKKFCETSYHTEKFNRSPQAIVDQLMKMGVTPNGGFLFLGCGVSHPKDQGLKPHDTVILSADFLPLALTNECTLI